MQMFVSTNQKTAGTTVNVSLITSSVLQYYSSKVCGFVALEPRCSEDRGDTHQGTIYDYTVLAFVGRRKQNVLLSVLEPLYV